ncbi:DUF742 domain-containing protein [Streptomyces sp. NPDC048172]|uniref:DUF742 domain-containing protein n=1 Tax=Streptomyces sp. NPDC048172 TaxID=3365505 RepID=UPI00371EA2DE
MTERWFDDAAGPVVRPYAKTRGRTRSGPDETRIDLIAVVTADGAGEAADGEGAETAEDVERVIRAAEDEALLPHRTLVPEHVDIVERCRRSPLSVAELASELDVPVGVVRVLLGDLMEAELVRVTRPVPPAELPDESILREVINGLRAL